MKNLNTDWLKSNACLFAGAICRERGDFGQAERYHRESVAVNQKSGFYNYADNTLTDTLIMAGKFEEAAKRAEAQLRLAEMIGSGPFQISVASKCLTWALLHIGKFSQARSFGAVCLNEAKKINSYTKIMALNLLAQLDLLEDQTEAALERLQEALETLKGYKQVFFASTPLTVLSYVFLRQNQPDQAEAQLRSSLQEAIRLGSFHGAVNALPALALLEAAQGKQEQAIKVYEIALQFPYIANSKWFEEAAGKQISALKARLPVDQVDGPVERGSSLEMWHVIKDWLGDFQTGAGLAKPASHDLENHTENSDSIDLFFNELRELLKDHQ
jgi:tetratricopeptide (TPR) repeat protein